MNNTIFTIEKPVNERVYSYAKGRAERAQIAEELDSRPQLRNR